jgi:hypothetical protein
MMLRALLSIAAALMAHAQAHAAAWPEVALPSSAAIVDMGQQVTAQGMPMRLTGFAAGESPAVLAAWFHKHLDKPLMENKLGNKLVMGRRHGGYYITIQLEGLPQGTRGLVAVTDMEGAMRQRGATAALRERYLAQLPQGSRVISFLSSSERGVASLLLAVNNSYSEDVNRDRVRQLMRDEGLEFEREAKPEEYGGRPLPAGAVNGSTLFFKGRGKDAMAVICRDREGRVTVVLNTTSHMEQLK